MNIYTFKISFMVLCAALSVLSCSREGGVTPEADHGSYLLAVSAGYGEEVSTRAFMTPGGGTYYWTAGDRIGLTVTPAGSLNPLILHLPMEGDHSGQVLHTTFTGALTDHQVNALNPESHYDYYSYFPYQQGISGTFPNIQFPIPSTITVSPNIFQPEYAPMVAVPHTNEKPIVYLNSNRDYLGDTDLLHFEYRHVMSYAALAMECNLMSQPITSITIENQNGTILSGLLNVDLRNGSYGWASGGSTSITVSIPAGLEVGETVYIPMPPGNMSGQTFRLRFSSNVGNSVGITIPGGNFQRGQIHNLRVRVPFRVNFSEAPAISATSGNPFTYKGYTFWKNSILSFEDGSACFPGKSFPFNLNGTPVLLTPAISLATMSGRTDIPVQIKMVAAGGMGIRREMYYKAVAAGNIGILTTEDALIDLKYGYSGNEDKFVEFTSAPTDMISLTAETPCVAFNYLTGLWFTGRLQEIQLIPVYSY